MNCRQFIESLKTAGLKAEIIRAQALEKYERAAVDEAMKAVFPDFHVASEPAPASAPAAAPAPVASPAPVVDAAREIAELCTLAGMPEKATPLILEKKTVAEVRVYLAAEKAKANPPVHTPAQVSEDEVDKARELYTGALSLRSGIAADKVDKAQDIIKSGARNIAMVDIARNLLEIRGVNCRHLSRDMIIKRALGMTTGDFTSILANTANKWLAKGYVEAQTTFQRWTGVGTLVDFKSTDIAQMSGFTTLEEVPEGHPAPQLSISDAKETAKLLTYAGLFVLSRQAIYNDDLGAFTGAMRGMSVAAKRKLNKLSYGVLTSNSLTGDTMADGYALIDTTYHRNYLAAAAISETSIAAMKGLLQRQYDAKSNLLNIQGKYFLVNTYKEYLALKYLSTLTQVIAVTAATVDTLYRGMFEVISDAELDTAAASSVNYYLVADPNLIDTVTVFYLNGNQTPELIQEDSRAAEPDGVTYKVRLDAAVKAVDYRGIAYGVGA